MNEQEATPRIVEYRACLDQVQQATQREWAAVTVAGGVYTVVLLVAINVFPSDFYPVWVKVCAAWIAFAILTLVNVAFVVGMQIEIYWHQVAFRRMLDLEDSLGFRLMRRGYLLIRRPWQTDWTDLVGLGKEEIEGLRRDLEEGVYGVVPARSLPEYMRPLGALLAILQLILLAIPIIMTVFLVSK
jgi:hypothetical protein